MRDLIAQYEDSLDNLRRCKKQSHSPNDAKLLASMDESMRYAIEQMGRYVDKFPTQIGKREISVEPVKLAALAQWDPIEKLFQVDIPEPDEELRFDFRIFTNREIKALTLYLIDGWSYKQIAQRFEVQPGTVSRFIRRAREKIRKLCDDGLQTTIFDLDGEMQNTDSYLSGVFRPEHKVG